jgi:hypothetical protein
LAESFNRIKEIAINAKIAIIGTVAFLTAGLAQKASVFNPAVSGATDFCF